MQNTGDEADKVGARVPQEAWDIFERDTILLADFAQGGILEQEISYIESRLKEAGPMIPLFADNFSLYRWARGYVHQPMDLLVEKFHKSSLVLSRLGMSDVKFSSMENLQTDFESKFGVDEPLLKEIKGCDLDNNLVVRVDLAKGNDALHVDTGVEMMLFYGAHLHSIVSVIESRTGRRQGIRQIIDFSNFEVMSLQKYRAVVTTLQEAFPELSAQYLAITGTVMKYLLSIFRYLLELESFTNITDKLASIGGDRAMYLVNFFKHYIGEASKKKWVNITIEEETGYLEGITMERLMAHIGQESPREEL